MKNQNLLYLTAFLCLLCAGALTAQGFDVAGLKYNSYLGGDPQNADDENFSAQEYELFFNYPKKFNEDKTVMINGLAYAFSQMDLLYSSRLPDPTTADLHLISYKFRLVHNLNEKWLIVPILEPTIASDLREKLSTDDFFLIASLLLVREFSDNFKIGGGVAYTTRFGRPRIIPVIPLQWIKNRHRFNVSLPVKVQYAFDVTEKFACGVKMSIDGANYNLAGYENLPARVNKFSYTLINTGLQAEYKLGKSLILGAFGGITASGQLQYMNAEKDFAEQQLPPSGFFQISLSMRVFED